MTDKIVSGCEALIATNHVATNLAAAFRFKREQGAPWYVMY
jgi:hypothetical protein